MRFNSLPYIRSSPLLRLVGVLYLILLHVVASTLLVRLYGTAPVGKVWALATPSSVATGNQPLETAVLVLVLSAANGRLKRDAVRETWALYQRAPRYGFDVSNVTSCDPGWAKLIFFAPSLLPVFFSVILALPAFCTCSALVLHFLYTFYTLVPHSANLSAALWKSVFILMRTSRAVTRFLVGTRDLEPHLLLELTLEQQQHGDLAMVDTTDQYNSLTYKVVAGFRWAVHSYRFSHLLKVRFPLILSLTTPWRVQRKFGRLC